MRKLSEELCLTIKAKWRELVKVSGGTDHAVALTGAAQSRISEYGAPQHMDRFPRIDQIAHLELDCGMPIITRWLADIYGFNLVQRESHQPVGIHAHFARIVREAGEAQTAMANAMADGVITEQERIEIIKEAQEAANALQAMIAEFRNKGLKVVGQ